MDAGWNSTGLRRAARARASHMRLAISTAGRQSLPDHVLPIVTPSGEHRLPTLLSAYSSRPCRHWSRLKSADCPSIRTRAFACPFEGRELDQSKGIIMKKRVSAEVQAMAALPTVALGESASGFEMVKGFLARFGYLPTADSLDAGSAHAQGRRRDRPQARRVDRHRAREISGDARAPAQRSLRRRRPGR